MRPTHSLCVLLFLAACGGTTGQRELRYPVVAVGETGPFAVGGWQVTLTRAQVGFGPAYFCATSAASSELCPTAITQFARTATVNALDPAEQALGEADGEMGTVRSATYDFAYTWFPTQRQPTPAAGAPDGHSAVFEGQATQGAVTVRFLTELDVVPRIQGTRAVEGARASAELTTSDVQRRISMKPSLWFRGVDFDELALSPSDPVRLAPGTRAYGALILAMTATGAPTFTWEPQP